MKFGWRVPIFWMMGVFLYAVSGFALEVIVDNDNTSCTITGSWTTSTSSCYGANKYTRGPGTGANSITWRAVLPAGWYRVDFRVNSNTTYSTAARYTVTHRDGTNVLIINQQRGSSSFFILGGAYYFDGLAVVTLSDEFDAGTGSLVIADAIRFWSIFSFVQMSDSHVGYSAGTSQLTQVANELKTLGKMEMGTYGFSAPPPSFGIHSGDTTEYGQEYWNTFQNLMNGLPFPVYVALGNHDSAQNLNREKIRTRHGAPFYSFDHIDQGTRFRFYMINSPVMQSPRAAFAREELDWMAADMATLEPEAGAFLVYHHPINGASDPKPYDAYRLLETLRPYKALIGFYGHNHSFNTTTFDGFRLVQGGATYNDTSGVGGYNIITVAHNRIHVARKTYNNPTTANILSNMAIPAAPTYPTITLHSPGKDSIQATASLNVSASIAGTAAAVTAVDVEMDNDANWRPMAGTGYGPYSTAISMTGAVHGRHWVRVRFTMDSGGPFYKTIPFWTWDAYPKLRWLVDLGASSLSVPAVENGRVYVGTHGGTFRCVEAAYGAQLWKVNLPSDVITAPAVSGNRVVFGCGDGKVYCLNTATGATLWTKTCSGPVYSSPVIEGDSVYIGSNGTGASNSAYLYGIRLDTGAERWKYAVGNAIEARPCVADGTVFVGSWDSYFYAINTATGTQRWRHQRNSNRYYSPADSWPVATSSRVFVADREYVLNGINIATGTSAWTRASVSSQGLTPDGTGLLQRVTTGNLEHTNLDNTSTVWARACSLDSAPVSPFSRGTRTAIVDQDGLASVVALSNGALQYQFSVSSSYQLSGVSLDDEGNLYAATNEGFLLCVSNQAPPPNGVPDQLLEACDATGNPQPAPVYSDTCASTNTWVGSSAKGLAPGFTGTGSRCKPLDEENPGSATMVPTLPVGGAYRVYAMWTAEGNARNVTYQITHSGGVSNVTFDQVPPGVPGGTNSGVWQSLGNYVFLAGQNPAQGAVCVQENTVTGPVDASQAGVLSVDGFLWVYLGTSGVPDWRELSY